MPSLAPQPDLRDAKAVRQLGSRRAEKMLVPPAPSSLDAGGRTRMHAFLLKFERELCAADKRTSSLCGLAT
jgi:hypothetical protein